MLQTPPYQSVFPTAKTWFDEGIEQGLDNGQRRTIALQLKHKFGALSTAVQQRLDNFPADRLDQLTMDILNAGSLRELGLED